VGAFGALGLTFGSALYMHGYANGGSIAFGGFAIIILVMIV
jgi:hypothetical protein